MLVGILDVSAGKKGLWPSGGLCVLWLFVYSLTIGPLAVCCVSMPKFDCFVNSSIVQHNYGNFFCSPTPSLSRTISYVLSTRQHYFTIPTGVYDEPG